MKKSCFTLIELLIVIAIIAILAGMLLPALGSVKHRAYAIKCASNFKASGMALLFYANDNDTWFPKRNGPSFFRYNATPAVIKPENADLDFPSDMSNYWPELPKNTKVYYGAIGRKTMKTSPYACPSARPSEENDSGELVSWKKSDYFYTQGYNKKFGPGNSRPWTKFKSSRWRHPGRLMMMTDSTADVVDSSNMFTRTYNRMDARHNGALNVLFADGHVDLLKKEEIPDGAKTSGVANKAFYNSLSATASWF